MGGKGERLRDRIKDATGRPEAPDPALFGFECTPTLSNLISLEHKCPRVEKKPVKAHRFLHNLIVSAVAFPIVAVSESSLVQEQELLEQFTADRQIKKGARYARQLCISLWPDLGYPIFSAIYDGTFGVQKLRGSG